MNVVRHVKEYRLQILEDTQVIKFRCLRQAVDDRTGFGTGRCIVEVEVFTSNDIRSCTTASSRDLRSLRQMTWTDHSCGLLTVSRHKTYAGNVPGNHIGGRPLADDCIPDTHLPGNTCR